MPQLRRDMSNGKKNVVVDANIIISALIAQAFSLKLLLDNRYPLYTPDFVFEEIIKHEDEIIQKSGLTKREVGIIFGKIIQNVRVVQIESYWCFKQEATELIADPKDWPYIAVALFSDGIIWTYDAGFSRQQRIVCVTTHQLMEKYLK